MIRLLSCALFLIATQAQAVMLLNDPATPTVRNNGTLDVVDDTIIGFSFVLAPGDYILDSLMFWDGPNMTDLVADAGDGLADGVTVRLWDGTSQIASSTFAGMTVGAPYVNSTQATANNGIGQTFTSTGQTFYLSANVDAGENSFMADNGFSAGSALLASFVSDVRVATDAPDAGIPNFPDNPGTFFNTALLGPNASITQVPEPGSWTLIGLVGMVAAARRWRNSLSS